jgi:hypothetical protein
MGRPLLDQGRFSGGVYDENTRKNQEIGLTGDTSTAKLQEMLGLRSSGSEPFTDARF